MKATAIAIQQFMYHFTSILLHAAAYGFHYAKPRITATTVRIGDIKVTLLDTPGVGSLMNGRELSEHDIFNLVRMWLSCKRHDTLLTGILYFQNTVTGRDAQLDIDCFSEICKSNNLYQSVVLVATGEQFVEHMEVEISLWREAVSQGAKAFSQPATDLYEYFSLYKFMFSAACQASNCPKIRDHRRTTFKRLISNLNVLL